MSNNSKPAETRAVDNLRITEIFCSLQGESRTIGWPTTFIRLTGCPLRCRYCDTEYAFRDGTTMSQQSILEQVGEYGVQHVTVTGGEPLAQKAVHHLLKLLCDTGYQVSLETSGALAIDDVDARVSVVMDIKTPSSGEQAKNVYDNIPRLKSSDEVKFVIGSREDYEWACGCILEHNIAEHCDVLMSPVFSEQDAAELANWIVDDRLPVRFQLQLHKLLWGDKPGH